MTDAITTDRTSEGQDASGQDSRGGIPTLSYQSGFGQHYQTEAIAGALPRLNNPLNPPFGLRSEMINSTAFMAPRAHSQRSYVFRLRPSSSRGKMRPYAQELLQTAPLATAPSPNQVRWGAWGLPETPQDFVDGLITLCANGDARLQAGMAIHIYLVTRSNEDRFFACLDGEMLIIPQDGNVRIFTEFGILDAEPGEFVLIPRSVKFRLTPLDGKARGFVCENYGVPFRLPDLGAMGSSGLANAIDFRIPVAAYEDRAGKMELIQKFGGRLWTCNLDYSPLDVVAWRGSLAPSKFHVADFMSMGAVSAEHADPSIFTALTSPSDPVLGSNADFLVIAPQWVIGEDTFRGAPFHRNTCFEFAAMVQGNSPNKGAGSGPGSMIIHNVFAPHGPDTATLERLTSRDPAPFRLENIVFIAMESRFPMSITEAALNRPECQPDYADCWSDFRKPSKLSENNT